jgi:hypothetical protein
MSEHNLEKRRDFVDQIPCLSYDAMQSVFKSRQVRASEVLELLFSGEKIYPTFQFDSEGKLKPGIKAALAILRDRRSPWKIAFWFKGEGAGLNGKRPMDRLDDIEWLESSARYDIGHLRSSLTSTAQPTL